MDKREDVSPNMGLWQSPEEFPASTPDNDGSSRQDSGYSSSVTPRSAHSASPSPGYPRVCQFCHKPVVGRYQSTPVCSVCTCHNLNYIKVQSPCEWLTTIREGEISPSPLCSWPKRNRPLELDDDSMDASLYPDSDLGTRPSTSESNECAVNTMDITDETSIDFVDKMFALPSSSAIEDTMDDVSESKIPPVKEIPTKSLVKKPSSKSKKAKVMSFVKMMERVHRCSYVVNTFKSSLRGIEEVDLLFQLGKKRNFQDTIHKIFSYLPDKDLNSVWLVSSTWKELVEEDKVAFERLNLYKTKLMLRKENYSSPAKAGGSGGRGQRQAFGVLMPITNLRQSPASPPRRSPPLSPSSARHRHARQVACTVKKGDRVLKCPRCAFSVPDHGRSPSAQCRRSGCRHRFCVYCCGEVTTTTPHDCPPPLLTPRSATKSASKVHPVGSKDGKRNLRRTLIGLKNS